MTTVEKLVKHIKKDINTLSKMLKSNMEDQILETPVEEVPSVPVEETEDTLTNQPEGLEL